MIKKEPYKYTIEDMEECFKAGNRRGQYEVTGQDLEKDCPIFDVWVKDYVDEKTKNGVINIDDIDISIRCHQSLERLNIKYLEQLSNYTPDELLLSHVVKRTIQELEEQMGIYHISWRSKK
jgi:DNA-directed RNA polymerase alpha subunit